MKNAHFLFLPLPSVSVAPIPSIISFLMGPCCTRCYWPCGLPSANCGAFLWRVNSSGHRDFSPSAFPASCLLDAVSAHETARPATGTHRVFSTDARHGIPLGVRPWWSPLTAPGIPLNARQEEINVISGPKRLCARGIC